MDNNSEKQNDWLATKVNPKPKIGHSTWSTERAPGTGSADWWLGLGVDRSTILVPTDPSRPIKKRRNDIINEASTYFSPCEPDFCFYDFFTVYFFSFLLQSFFFSRDKGWVALTTPLTGGDCHWPTRRGDRDRHSFWRPWRCVGGWQQREIFIRY